MLFDGSSSMVWLGHSGIPKRHEHRPINLSTTPCVFEHDARSLLQVLIEERDERLGAEGMCQRRKPSI